MKCDIRRLSLVEIKSLSEMFATEKNENSVELWQDRKNDFLKIYQPIINGEPLYWGAFINGKIVGTTGLIPLNITPAYGINKVWMDTDLFITPEFRSKKIGHQLVLRRFTDGKKEMNQNQQLFFGIEQTPDQLDLCTGLGKKHEIHFVFPRNTRLRQEFLTQKLDRSRLDSACKQSSTQHSTQSCLLSELTDIQISQWIQANKNENFLNFSVDLKTIRKLIELDPDASAIFVEKDQKLLLGCILLSQGQGRSLRLNGKNSLFLERLRKNSGSKLQAGDELKVGVLGLGFGTDYLRTLAPQIQAEAEKKNFHCLAYRTQMADETALFSTDWLDFTRRIFIVFRYAFPESAALLSDIKNDNLQINLDSIFL